MLAHVIQNGFPKSHNDLPPIVGVFWPMREELYCLERVTVKGNKILIPRQLWAEVLELLHAAHQGVNAMLANPRQRLFWLGLATSIRQTRSQCRIRNRIALSQGTLDVSSRSGIPVSISCCGLRGHTEQELHGFADRYTGWVEVAWMSSGNAKNVCDTMRTWFCTYGAPKEISSDGGPPFESQEYNTFLKNWKRTSSTYYPQRNGRAELAVKTAKRILFGNRDNCERLICTQQ